MSSTACNHCYSRSAIVTLSLIGPYRISKLLIGFCAYMVHFMDPHFMEVSDGMRIQ